MVFQEPMTALNPVMPVGRQIAEVLTLHLGLPPKQAWAKAVALLAETGIHEPETKARAYPFQLSGGQAPAGDDCDGGGGRAAAFDCR